MSTTTSVKAFLNETITLAVEANATGLTDVTLAVTAPSGASSTLSATEVGTTKVYTYDFAPTELGTYVIKIVSPTDTAIDGKPRLVTVQELSREDLGGATYDPATDSLEAISNKVDSLVANSSTSGGHL